MCHHRPTDDEREREERESRERGEREEKETRRYLLLLHGGEVGMELLVLHCCREIEYVRLYREDMVFRFQAHNFALYVQKRGNASRFE